MWQQHLEFLYLSLFCCKFSRSDGALLRGPGLHELGDPKRNVSQWPVVGGTAIFHDFKLFKKKNYLEAFDDLKCCVDGRPFCEGLYPTVSVPFSPNQSDLQMIFSLFFPQQIFISNHASFFQLKNAEALRWISLHVPRSGVWKVTQGFWQIRESM